MRPFSTGYLLAPTPLRRPTTAARGRTTTLVVALAVLSALSVGVTEPASASGSERAIWSKAKRPVVSAVAGSTAKELGVRFKVIRSGQITGIRFYKGRGNSGRHRGRLWTATGRILASVSFSDETRRGWQDVRFKRPVRVAPGAVYVASYYAPRGHHAVTRDAFRDRGAGTGPVRALRRGGAVRLGSQGFPNRAHRAHNYWVTPLWTPLPVAVEIFRRTHDRADKFDSALAIPATPSGLSVTGVTPNSVSLAWSDGADETGYRVERSAAGASTWTSIGSTAENATTVTDTSALPATAYFYRAVAFNTAGTSAASSAIVATTPADSTVGTCSGVTVSPGVDLPSLMGSKGPGTVYCFQAGTYRLRAAIAPKTGDVLSGVPGTVISGALPISTWAANGSLWTADGYLPAAYTDTGYNPCQDTVTNLCKLNEWLFQDNVPLRRVASAAAVGAGTYYTDYAANRIYVGSNPEGSIMELSRAKTAIESVASGVTVKGLVVEKFATANQRGAIVANGPGWTIQGCEVRFNHGAGIYGYANNLKVLNSRVHHNGTIGIAVYNATGVLIDGNELDHNNTDGSFVNDGQNGGYKSAKSTDIVRNNNVHDNMGLGLWFDIDDKGSLIENNNIADNASDGIRYEISYDGVIRNNVLSRNGQNRQTGNGSLYYGASVTIANSTDVQVYGNVLTGGDHGIGLQMQNRGSGTYGVWQLANVYVHDNTVSMVTGQSGLVQNVGDASLFTSRNNRFERNNYTLDSVTGIRFNWNNAAGSFSYWQRLGQDVGGLATLVP